jgi:hypothetical protein
MLNLRVLASHLTEGHAATQTGHHALVRVHRKLVLTRPRGPIWLRLGARLRGWSRILRGRGVCDVLVDRRSPGTGRARAAHHSHAAPRRLGIGKPTPTGDAMRRREQYEPGQNAGVDPSDAAASGEIGPSRSLSEKLHGRGLRSVRCVARRGWDEPAKAQGMVRLCPPIAHRLVWSHFRDGGQQVEPLRSSPRDRCWAPTGTRPVRACTRQSSAQD